MRNRFVHIIWLMIVITITSLLFFGCTNRMSLEEIHSKAEEYFRDELQKKDIHNAFLTIYSPSKEIDWTFAGGYFADGKEVSASNPFYTASIGKTFTATAIAMLVDQQKLSFNDPINMYLPDSVMLNLHHFKGVDYSHEITIAHLLQHTSGLPDYFEDPTVDGSPNVMELLFSNPNKYWYPTETIEFAKTKMKPLFKPGTDYHYTDTEYVLLGLVIERISNTTLHDFFREQFFIPLNMNDTYMLYRSQAINQTARFSEIFVGDNEVSGMKSLSADWAGGGLVSTAADLIKFQEALFTGKIVSDSTLGAMQQWIPESFGMEYGYGLRRIVFKELFPILPDFTLIGHSGSTGSFMYYCPELDVYLSGTLNQTDEVKESVKLLVKILVLLNKN